jgi:hypothetical protein
MKLTPESMGGPQVLPASFGPEPKIKVNDFGPQILPGQFGPAVKVADNPHNPQILPGYTGPAVPKNQGPEILPAIFGPPQQMLTVPNMQSMFPAATGLPGEPSLHLVDTYQGGPAGLASKFGIRSGWTYGF